jgi:FtsP/CotA-like multicopper oxidase with cupredoxin domain
MLKINRRQFFILSTASAIAGSGADAIATSLGNCAIAQSKKTLSASSNIYKSSNGLLEVNLAASAGQVTLAGKQAYLLSYNGQVPAPRLEAKAGDTVRIHFTNNLSQPTNLHYHGLHVSPNGNADNPFLSIPPGESLTYEFTIPKNHPSGTLEEFLVLKDFDLDAGGRIIAPNHMAMMLGREGGLLTVNGQVKPNLSIDKGGLLRLRVLNASSSRFYRLSLENHPFYLIATDGGAVDKPVQLNELLLAPGERAEVLVRGEKEPEQYRLLNLPYDRGGMGMMGGRRMGQFDRTSPQVLATLTYRGSVATLPLPERLIPVETLPEVNQRRFRSHGSSFPLAY